MPCYDLELLPLAFQCKAKLTHKLLL